MATTVEIRNTLLAATEGCLAMQADHLAGLQNGSLSKIGQWIEERQAMVAKLRQAFSEAVENGIDQDLRELLLERIQRLMEGETLLYAVAERQKDAVSDSLSFMRRGKRALSGYGGASLKNGPRFVSGQG